MAIFKSGDKCGFFLTLGHIFFWVSEEKKQVIPTQILYNKLEKYLSLSIYKNIYSIHIKFRFSQWKMITILSTKDSDY